MPTPVILPKMGMTMTEGTLTRWLVEDGASVEAGQPLFEMETEKIDTEVEAPAAGILRHLAAADAVVAAGGIVGCILAPGEELPEEYAALAAEAQRRAAAPAAVAPPPPAAAAPAVARPFVPASPAARRLARELGVDLTAVSGSGPEGRVTEDDVRRHAGRATAPAAAARPSLPARRLAERHGLDLASVEGKGPGGRIGKKDVERALGAKAAPAAVAAAPRPGQTVPFKGMRRTVAERMHQSLQTMAQLTMTTQADVTEAVRLREQLVQEWEPEGVRPTYTDFVLRAVAVALPEHPRVNATLEGDNIRLLSEVDLGLAVSLEEGLIVPVIHGADRLSLKEIARLSAELAAKARAGTLSVDEVSGGTFTVTSLGPYGVDTFTPIVNPPQTAILGVGRIKEVAAFEGGRAVPRKALDLSLTFDHRLVDGAQAAEFLSRVRELLESPDPPLIQD